MTAGFAIAPVFVGVMALQTWFSHVYDEIDETPLQVPLLSGTSTSHVLVIG